MSAREAWPQCLPVLLLDSNGLGAFLSREMHKWKFLTPQRRLGLCGGTLEKAASLPRRQTHWVLQDKELEEQNQQGHHSALGTKHTHTHTHTHTHVHPHILYNRTFMQSHTKSWNAMFKLSQIPLNTLSQNKTCQIYHNSCIIFPITAKKKQNKKKNKKKQTYSFYWCSNNRHCNLIMVQTDCSSDWRMKHNSSEYKHR